MALPPAPPTRAPTVRKKDEGATAQDNGATGAGGGDSESKSHKHKKSKKEEETQVKRTKRMTDKEGGEKDKGSTAGDLAMPLKKTPEKAERPQTGDESSKATPKTPSKKKPIRSLQECRQDKWASDTPLAIWYRQRQGYLRPPIARRPQLR